MGLAAICYHKAEYFEAERLYRGALDVLQDVHGPESKHIITGLNNLALVVGDQGRYEEAESLYRRSLAISEVTQSAEHVDTANTLNNIAALYYMVATACAASNGMMATARSRMMWATCSGEPLRSIVFFSTSE
jgi:tetratricopeptide (TPR) repeat protein